MAQDNKVVSLKTQGLVSRVSLPGPLIRLRDTSAQELRRILSDFFDSSDDVLFNMSEKALSTEDQAAYFNAMRELRLQRKNMTISILQWVSRSFNELGRFDPVPGMMALDQVDQDSLSLMDQSDLEQSVAIDNLMNKLRNHYAEPARLLGERVQHLVPDLKLESRQIPLSPETICTGLAEASGDLEIDIRAKLIVFKLFDKLLISKLQELYEAANELLVKEGVLPQLKRASAAKTAAKPAPPAPRSPVPPRVQPVKAESSAQQALNQARQQATFSELSALLHRDGGGEGAAAGGGGTIELDTSGLMELLSSLQKPAQAWGDGAVPSLTVQLNPIFKPESGPGYALKQVDNDVINLVSMLFEFILEDRQLPAEMKALIGRLQIPVLKVALSDQSFFNRGGHPARKLLNELALAGLSWSPKGEGQRDPLKDKIESVVGQLLDNYSDNIELFAELLTDFSHFMDLDNRRRALVEQRLRDAEEGRAKQEQAKTKVDEVLAELSGDRDVPPVVVEFLENPWRKYLQWSVLRDGDGSSRWASAVELTRQLIWSVDPQPVVEQTRSDLLRAIPSIVDGLRKGLQTISWDPFATDNAIRDLELAHVDVFQRLVTSQMVERSPQLREPDVAAVEAQPAIAPLETTTAQSAQSAQPAAAPSEPSAGMSPGPQSDAQSGERVGEEWLARADALRVGSWVELLSHGNRVRCKLAAFIKTTGKYIFVNRNGAKVAEYFRDDLARALADQEIAMLDDGLIFDRALESIIDNLRSNRRD
ncbi:DUF1631 domain-containing protein [Marinobacter sp. SS21]|uniref:DUF1631 domain-containing protein n=1 Tax=Marinobacter sp. SS21 TaxID=2979460 RepID=UPI00232D950E|nr:DUF1631 domain-containing protein [Marinobacter sp. SS21]MDC0663922.1 DUF1631 domain-containing protein [Marinobacter sp. SS21]